MEYLDKNKVIPGAIVPIYLEGKLEGYGKLIEQEGEMWSFIEKDFEDSEKADVFVKERWLIEWVSLDEINVEIDNEIKWSQRYLSGKKTHRRVTYKAASSWNEYVEIYGPLKEKNYYSKQYMPGSSNY